MERTHCYIRSMAEDDQSDVFFLAEEVLRPLAAAAGHPERFHEQDMLVLLRHSEVFVAATAEAGGDVAGCCAVDQDAEGVHVRCLVVGPAFEARQVGHQLVEWIEGLAYARGAARVTAALPREDERSARLYRAHDFVPVSSPDRPELIVMEKRLPES